LVETLTKLFLFSDSILYIFDCIFGTDKMTESIFSKCLIKIFFLLSSSEYSGLKLLMRLEPSETGPISINSNPKSFKFERAFPLKSIPGPNPIG
jgi:hypothetical protein